METEKVGMREFREQLGTYLESDRPVAITKHGRTVGFYIPARRHVELEDQQALREAGRLLDIWMADHKLDTEELTAEFDRARKSGRKRS